jgi:hypothetical protein
LLDLVGRIELARLENLSRTCDEIDPQSKRALRLRETFARLGRNDLRARLDNDRSLLEPVRLGPISHSESGGKAVHAFRFASNIPAFIHISDGKIAGVNVLDILQIEVGDFLYHGPRLCGRIAP